MIDVISFLPSKRKQTSSGWISFNAPCCIHNGDSQDKRMRGGLLTSPDQSWSYHCFNCGFKASFVLGRPLAYKAKKLLEWLGVDKTSIEMMNLESLKHKSINGLLENNREVIKAVEFEEKELPPNLVMLDSTDPEHSIFCNYLQSRSIDYTSYPYMIDPKGIGRNKTRIVIPFTHKGMIVGNCSRYLDDKTPKYINDMQQGYVFGTDLQRDKWQHAIVVEGVFDALSINGLAVLHNDINPQQIQLIKSIGRTITVVPDQDEAGMKLVDRAIELGWGVSMPEWPEGIKDVNDAVIQLGQLATLLIILANRETSKIKIELAKRRLRKTYD